MNRSKLALALLVVAIAALGYWLWTSRGDAQPEFATPVPAPTTAEPRGARESPSVPVTVDDRRGAAPEVASERETAARPHSPSHDFTVRGHVFVQGSRVPIPGAELALCEGGDASITESDGEPFARTTSDEQGAFELFLAGGAPNLFAMLATHEDFAPAWIDTVPGDVGDVEFDVELGPHFFIGVDVWAPGSRAIVFGADVRLSNANPALSEEWLQDVTDERGHCEFEVTGLPRKDLELIVAAEGCAPWLMHGLALEPGVQRRNVICNLEQSRSVRGRVIDALRKQPIAGAELEIVGRREEFESGGGEARSDSNGMFEIELRDCPVEFASLYVRAKGFRAGRFDQLEQIGLANQNEVVIELTAPAKLRGGVRARDGQPLNEASIDVAPSRLLIDAGDSVVVGADGTFELLLEQVPPGPARVTCQADGCATKTFEIIAEGGGRPLDIVLERALHVHGQVTRAADSRPMPGVRVRLLAANGTSRIDFANAQGKFGFYVAPKDALGARLLVELGGQRLAVSELPAATNPAELEHDIAVELVAASKAR